MLSLKPCYSIIIASSFLLIANSSHAQVTKDSMYIQVPASLSYDRKPSFQKKWGAHYRKEWSTPVRFRKAYLDTLAGGLTPYQLGGGRQSKSLRLRDKDEREYVLRSIDKTFGGALPEVARGTWVESLVNDQVTIAHPFSAITLPPMAEAAGIFHTKPVILYIPKQPALGKYSDSMGNTLYLFEQRPDENWETAANFGNSKNIINTENFLGKLLKDNDNGLDKQAYVRARLFDMFIGDWGRHEDQWRWAEFKDDDDIQLYKPVPRDRDQAYTIFDGKMLKPLISVAGAKHLQSFDYTIKDPVRFNFPARNLDLHLANSITVKEWITTAKDLQSRLTDNIIENAIKKLPPEIYPINGPSLTAKLKSRRDHLHEYAETYAKFLSRNVDITGTEKHELFTINGLSDTAVQVTIQKITKEGKIKDTFLYERIFYSGETKEIRLYGIDGNDQFKVKGTIPKGMYIRLVGGPSKDVYTNEGVTHQRKALRVYDTKENDFQSSQGMVKKLSRFKSVHEFDYKQFDYDKDGFLPMFFYSFNDRFFVGLAYNKTVRGWRKKPFASEHHFDVKYSITQSAWSSTYEGRYNAVLGNWDLVAFGNYDQVRWNNYFGIGNETLFEDVDPNYNRLRTRRITLSLGLERIMNSKHKISILPVFESIDVIEDNDRFIAKEPFGSLPETYKAKSFLGGTLRYVYQHLNDSILPVKGLSFIAWGNQMNNLAKDQNFLKYGSEFTGFIPFSRKLGLSIRAGAASFTGNPEFYQYNSIGGSATLRGYERDRFYGQSVFFNQNELRWITDFRSYLVNGKIGIFALYDMGRVWMPGEKSNKWHPGYGGGIIFSPFNKISGSIALATSPDGLNFHFDLLRPL